MDNPNEEPSMNNEKLTLEIERFSDLSSEMIALLSGLSRALNESATGLRDIRAEVDMRRKQLQTLHEIEDSAAVLEQQIQELQKQKENLERIVADQRDVWEREKERRAREEKEYYENLNLRRQQEEQEFKQMWAAEHEKARHQLEDELRVIQQQSRDAQAAVERDFRERESILKKKELEWGRLIQELEQFLFKLDKRNRPPTAFCAVSPGEAPAGQPSASRPDLPRSESLQGDSGFWGARDESNPGFCSSGISTWGEAGDVEDAATYDSGPIFGSDLIEDAEPSATPKRDVVPLKFAPKKPAGFTPED